MSKVSVCSALCETRALPRWHPCVWALLVRLASCVLLTPGAAPTGRKSRRERREGGLTLPSFFSWFRPLRASGKEGKSVRACVRAPPKEGQQTVPCPSSVRGDQALWDWLGHQRRYHHQHHSRLTRPRRPSPLGKRPQCRSSCRGRG